jgi:hypothetical protein
MAIGIAEVLAHLGQAVQLVVRHVLGEPVALVVGEVELARLRMEVEAHRVTHAAGHDLHAAAVQIDAADLGVFVGVGLADVARCAHGHVELSVGPDLDELPAVGDVARKLVVDRHGLGRIAELVLDAVVTGDGLRRRHIERALVELDAVREHQLLGDDLDLALAPLSTSA